MGSQDPKSFVFAVHVRFLCVSNLGYVPSFKLAATSASDDTGKTGGTYWNDLYLTSRLPNLCLISQRQGSAAGPLLKIRVFRGRLRSTTRWPVWALYQSMVKSMTGFPRDSDSESEDSNDEAPEKQPEKTPSKSAQVKGQAVGLKTTTFKQSKQHSMRTASADRPRKKGGCTVVLPSGLRDVSSVVIVDDPVFGPRLRRMLDEPTCAEGKCVKRRRPELLEVTVTKSKTKSAKTVRCRNCNLQFMCPLKRSSAHFVI